MELEVVFAVVVAILVISFFALLLACIVVPSCPIHILIARRQRKEQAEKQAIQIGPFPETRVEFRRVQEPLMTASEESSLTDEGNRAIYSSAMAHPTIEFEVSAAEVAAGRLAVTVVRVTNLPPRNFVQTRDPFVIVQLERPSRLLSVLRLERAPSERHKTRIVRRSLNPQFDQQFLLSIDPADIGSRALGLVVQDFDRYCRDTIMGQVTIPLGDLQLTQSNTLFRFNEPLVRPNPQSYGQLHISTCYMPTAKRLSITVIKAQKLKPAQKPTAETRLSTKLRVLKGGKVIQRRRTKRVVFSEGPLFQESVVLDMPADQNLNNIVILFIVIQSQENDDNEQIIGKTCLGLRCVESGLEQFEEMLQNPRKAITKWHNLQ